MKVKPTCPRMISNMMDFVVKKDPIGSRRISTE